MGRIISFDGLNRSGKGTQIRLLRDYLERRKISVEVLRGDGSRPGLGSKDFYDPPSDWWVDWQANSNKVAKDWDEAYQVLSEENNKRYKEFSIENQIGTILMDRSYISRYFMLKQQGFGISLEEIADGTELRPKYYFVLEAPKETLLERVSDDNIGKTEFRRDVVRRWYDLWVEVVYDAQNFLKERLMKIDGIQSPQAINGCIIHTLEEQ